MSYENYDYGNAYGAYGDAPGSLGDFGGQNITDANLLDVTRAKFGQGGVDAIGKYPCLAGARIAKFLYMEEAGGGAFTLRRQSNGAVFARNVDGCSAFTSSLGKTVYTPSQRQAPSAPASSGTSWASTAGSVAQVAAGLAPSVISLATGQPMPGYQPPPPPPANNTTKYVVIGGGLVALLIVGLLLRSKG